MPGNDPFHLILDGRYAEAVEAFSKLGKSDRIYLVNRGLAYLNLANFAAALSDFEAADRMFGEAGRAGDDCRERIGVVQWVSGERERAVRTWGETIDAHGRHEIKFSDPAGGVGVGALLWFGASVLRDEERFKEAERFLKKKAKEARSKMWPGPIGKYLLGLITEDDLLALADRVSGVFAERCRCRAFFYMGAKALRGGLGDEARVSMVKALDQGPVIVIENEYYLAKATLAEDLT